MTTTEREKDPRAAKRRRVSEASFDRDGDGDVAMGMGMTAGEDASPTKPETATGTGTETATPSRGPKAEADTKTKTPTHAVSENTPSRAGVRSSGRQRKAPVRYEDEVVRAEAEMETGSGPVRRASSRGTPGGKSKGRATTTAATPSVTTATATGADADADADMDMDIATDTPTRSARNVKRQSRHQPSPLSETDDENYKDEDETESEDEAEAETGSPRPRARRATRTKTEKASVRFAGDDSDAKKNGNGQAQGDGSRGSPADDFPDGLDDLVSMQLQQDLSQGDSNMEDSAEALPEYAERLQQFVRNGYEKEMQLVTKTVVEQLNGKRHVPLKGLENEHHKVHQLLEQTVSVGEGNSMLVLGSRGAGKTAIIETAVSSLAKEHKNDFHVVRLNGFLHTDDRLALREIWRQLGRETETEEEAGKVTSYADTMATLLALLSHPEELQGSAGNQNVTMTAKSIVIVLDGFDLFVSHPRQTLLYNLFDIAQARKAPLAVLGVTTKVDVTEMLEKRVKSRFSHRSVYVPLPRSFETFSEACLAGLDLPDELAKSNSWRIALEGWRGYLQVSNKKHPLVSSQD